MSRSPHRHSNSHLEIPRLSTELQDPGATGVESSEDDYFSDASEGRRKVSRPQTPNSPIPITRVEKVDDNPGYGDLPGTDAYEKRRQDAVPDEVEVVPEGQLSKRNSRQFLEATSPGGSLVPRTVVEKVDPDSPSYGEVPGTEEYKKRLADATPDVILKTPNPGKGPHYKEDFSHRRTPSGNPIPETVVTRVDDELAYGEVEGTEAAEMRRRDASPDRFEIKKDPAGSPTFDRFVNDGPPRRKSTLKPDTTESVNDDDDDDDDNDFGDDFDDFEEGAQAGADDDFGEFDDGFQEPTPGQTTPTQHVQPEIPTSSFPLIDFEALSSLPDLLSATQMHLDTMFPTTTSEYQSTMPKPEPIPSDSPVFPSERSQSLWKQLITPPPLQPPNWTQSRIRRLFLISLGVPVDLDEILPPSKQKKLILPGLERTAESGDGKDTLSRLRSQKDNASSTSLAESTSSQPGSKSKHKRTATKQQAPPPSLDLPHVKRLCATTDEKLDNFTDKELQDHVKELEELTERTRELLEYWLKRRDGLRKEKEAFEGVIQNLVRHMNRVRK